MNGFILAATMATLGQQCYRLPNGQQVCPNPRVVVRSQPVQYRPAQSQGNHNATPADPGWEEIACEVMVKDCRKTGMGSGTIITSNDQGKELVLTARHVINSDQPVSIRWKGTEYPAKFVKAAPDGDISVIETDIPGKARPLELSTSAPDHAWIYGYGQSRKLHAHSMRFLGNVFGDPDDIYTPAGNEGDSGAGVFAPDGSLCGVFVAYENQEQNPTHNSVVVSARTLCRFLTNQTQASSGRTRLIIFPFFWFGKQWTDSGQLPQQGPCQPYQQQPQPLPYSGQPTQPVQPQPVAPVNPPAVAQGPQGLQGIQGLQGQKGDKGDKGDTGAAGQSIDPNALTTLIVQQVLAQLKNQPAAAPPPIYFQVVGANGTASAPTKFTAQTAADGSLYYAIQLNASQLPSTSVPVTPVPPTPGK